MVQRLTFRRRNTHNSPSNKQRVVKTPGGRLVYQPLGKFGTKVKCADCKQGLNGIPSLRRHEFKFIRKNQRTVARAYGGNRCHKCVRNRILRAFLFEEKRCVAAVLSEKKRQKKLETSKGSKVKKTKKVAGKK